MQIKLSEKLERITERLGSDFLFVALQFKNYLTDIGCRIHENWSQRERLVFLVAFTCTASSIRLPHETETKGIVCRFSCIKNHPTRKFM